MCLLSLAPAHFITRRKPLFTSSCFWLSSKRNYTSVYICICMKERDKRDRQGTGFLMWLILADSIFITTHHSIIWLSYFIYNLPPVYKHERHFELFFFSWQYCYDQSSKYILLFIFGFSIHEIFIFLNGTRNKCNFFLLFYIDNELSHHHSLFVCLLPICNVVSRCIKFPGI